MAKRYSKEFLTRLRNQIPIVILISDLLELPNKLSEGYFRFLCPICSEFNTATNQKTKLARCFRCQKNFNPIGPSVWYIGRFERDGIDAARAN